MNNESKKVTIGSGDFLIEVENTTLKEWEGVQLHTHLTAYLNKIQLKNELSPLNSQHVREVASLAQEATTIKDQIDSIKEYQCKK
jgi:hypothetical protein